MLDQPTLPHSVQIRAGGVSFTCNPEEKVPYLSTKLARGSDVVLGTLRCPKHPDFNYERLQDRGKVYTSG